MKKICIVACVIVMLFVVGCAPEGVPPEPTPPGESDALVGQAFRYLDTFDTRAYAPPWDIVTGDMKFTTTPEGFTDIDTTSAISLDANAEGSFIYYQGYYYDSFASGWVPYEFDEDRYVVDGSATNWIETSASATLDFAAPFNVLSAGENYILVYICEWDLGWHCGPRDSADTDYHWTLQAFTVCGTGEIVDGDACRTVTGTIAEDCTNGADDDGDTLVDCADVDDCAADAACFVSACFDSDTAPGTDSFLTPGYVLPGDGSGQMVDSCAPPAADGRILMLEGVCEDGVMAATSTDCADEFGSGFECIDDGGGAYCGTPTGPPVAEICDNNVDDDGDGLVDCGDIDCVADSACSVSGCFDSDRGSAALVTSGFVLPTGSGSVPVLDACRSGGPGLLTEQVCGGSALNVNCDSVETPGYVCVEDAINGASCAAPAPAAEVCDNNVDDDGDGLVDCADRDCSADSACFVSVACSDSDVSEPDQNVVGGQTELVDAAGVTIVQQDTCDPTGLEVKEMSCSGTSSVGTIVDCGAVYGAGWTCNTDAAGLGYCEAPAPPACVDGDKDGYGVSGSAACTNPGLDCDDAMDTTYPGAPEMCNARDDDCDGTIDEDCPMCQDFDGRDDPSVASHVLVLSPFSDTPDKCAGGTLTEGYCLADARETSDYDCTIASGSCETDSSGYGRCAPPTDYCNDGDNSVNPTEASSVTYRSSAVAAEPVEGLLRDSCVSSTQLLELYCDGNVHKTTLVDCALTGLECRVNEYGDSFCGQTVAGDAPGSRVDFCTEDDTGDQPRHASKLKYRYAGAEMELDETCRDDTTLMEYECYTDLAGVPRVNYFAWACTDGLKCYDNLDGLAYCG